MVRKSNRFIIAQIVKSAQAQDFVIVGFSSKDLLGKGWPKEFSGSLKSLPACYLLGALLAKKAIEKKINEAVLDIGMYRSIGKSRIYAVVKGAMDSGLNVPCSSDSLPNLEQISKNTKVGKFLSLKENL